MEIAFFEIVQYYHIATKDNTIYRKPFNGTKWEVFKSGQWGSTDKQEELESLLKIELKAIKKQPKLKYIEKDLKNAYKEGAEDYCHSPENLRSFINTQVDIWFNKNKKK